MSNNNKIYSWILTEIIIYIWLDFDFLIIKKKSENIFKRKNKKNIQKDLHDPFPFFLSLVPVSHLICVSVTCMWTTSQRDVSIKASIECVSHFHVALRRHVGLKVHKKTEMKILVHIYMEEHISFLLLKTKTKKLDEYIKGKN